MIPIKILLVEDNSGDERLVKEALKAARVVNEVTVARDGAEAEELLESGIESGYRPDLILLDLNLPKKSGREVLSYIKNSEKHKSIPVIILTSSEAETDIEKTYLLGANSFLTKPVDFEEFVNCINAFENFWLTFVKFPKQP